MARKEIDITIAEEGRDRGKTFHIVEMPAWQAEKWALRALQAAIRSGVQIPDDMASHGMAAVAAIGIQALSGMNFAEVEPLLDEMFACVSIKPDRAHPEIVRRLVEDDIEEVWTRITLRREVLKLHTNFLIAGAPSPSTSANPPPASPNIQTSPAPSVRSSPRARPRL